MGQVIQTMETVARDLGAQFRCGEADQSIDIRRGQVAGVTTDEGRHGAEAVVASADSHKFPRSSYRTFSTEQLTNV